MILFGANGTQAFFFHLQNPKVTLYRFVPKLFPFVLKFIAQFNMKATLVEEEMEESDAEQYHDPQPQIDSNLEFSSKSKEESAMVEESSSISPTLREIDPAATIIPRLNLQ